jgi:hypothetical protein
LLGIFRSRWAMAFAVAAASAFALGWGLRTIATALLSGTRSVSTYKNLGIASYWMIFVSAVAILVAVAGVLWMLLKVRQWQLMWEAGAVAIGALLVVIGTLIQAVTSLTPPQSSNVVVAVGVGIWGILAVVVGARWALADEAHGTRSPHAPSWLTCAAGVAITAVAFGIPNPSLTDKGAGIAIGVVGAVGFGTIAAGVAYARVRGLLSNGSIVTIVGFGVLAAGEASEAIVAGLIFGPTPSLTAYRVGSSISTFILAVGLVVLADAAWIRLRRLPQTVRVRAEQQWGFAGVQSPTWTASSTPAGTAAPPPTPWAAPAPAPTPAPSPPPPRFCGACGCPVVPVARFCMQCGAPL